jgi:ABC-type oligopeptide transport system substrate-binding subunit
MLPVYLDHNDGAAPEPPGPVHFQLGREGWLQAWARLRDNETDERARIDAMRTFEESTVEIPLGSGPYKVGKYEINRYVEFDRVKDWWAAELPVCRGSYNFDTVRYEFYRDRDVAFEGFAGKNYLYREEFTARIWATRYDFPAIKDGRVKRETLPDELPSGGQGWFFNTRRDKFKDPRVREAVINAFDFEWINRMINYSSHKRVRGWFNDTDFEATGMPGPDELALLEPLRPKLSPKVFTDPAPLAPSTDTPSISVIGRAGCWRPNLFIDPIWCRISDGRS